MFAAPHQETIVRPTPAEIRAIRLAQHMSPTLFAALLGVSVPTVWRWEDGEETIPDCLLAFFRQLAAPIVPMLPTLPDGGAHAQLYHTGIWEWVAVAGPIAATVRPDQLTPACTAPDRIVLDRALAWEAAPAQIERPEAEYTITFKPHVLVLTRLGSTPQVPEPKPSRRALSLAHNGRGANL